MSALNTYRSPANLRISPPKPANFRVPQFGGKFEKLFYRTYPILLGQEKLRDKFMRKSIMYTIVLLTLFSLFFTLIPQAHSQTTNVKVVTYSWYIDNAGLLDVVGEIQNIGSSTISSVIIGGIATTTTGNQQTSNTMAYVKDMLPNQKAPFYMTFFLQTDQTTQSTPTIANVAVTVAQATETTNYLYQDVKVTSNQNSVGTGSDDKGVYWVTGTVKNTGSQTATNVRVLGTFYDSTGNVIAVGGYTDDALSASLAPSASTNFKFGAYDTNQTLMPENQQIASYALLVQVEGPIMQGTAPTITPGPTANSSPIGTSAPTATQNSDDQTPINNPTDDQTSSWLYPAIIVIVIALALGGAVLAFKKRKPQQVNKTSKKKK
jgi:hypothetical protein